MARYGGRSKACATCRRAKKKCDESYPQCGQCVAANKKCPGPIQGNVFVNADTSSVHASIKKRSSPPLTDRKNKKRSNHVLKQSKPVYTTVARCQTVSVVARGTSSTSTEKEQIPDALSQGLHSVALYNIQVISNLVYYYSASAQPQNGHNGERQSWLMQLPDMAHKASLNRMRAPLLAPSLLLLALQSRQTNVLKEALKWYDLGLNYVRRRLKDLDTNIPDEGEDIFLICAALLMSFYETLNNTVVDGYEQHVLGAVALLEAKGPELFTRREYHGLFRAIRGHAIHVSLMTGSPTCLADEKWLSIPFSHSSKSKSEKINDILLVIPRYLSEVRTQLSYTSDLAERELIIQSFMQNFGDLTKTLDGRKGQTPRLESPVSDLSSEYSAASINVVDDQHPDCFGFYNFSTAIEAKEAAMHACVEIILLNILSSETLSSPPSSYRYDDEGITRGIEQASALILSAAMFISQLDIGCAYMRMILPVQLVAQVSRNHAQRGAARAILQSWWQEKPIKGLAGLALQSIDSGSHNLLDVLAV